MAQLDFYNLSKKQKYPFVPAASLSFNSGAYKLDWRFILDCGFTLGNLSNFKMGYRAGDVPQLPDFIRLTRIERVSATEIEFEFTASSMPGAPFVFLRSIDDGDCAVGYTEAAGNPLYGVGFLVTGDLAPMFDPTSPFYVDSVLTPDGAGPIIEQALIVALPNQAVVTINVGNLPRMKAVSPQPDPVVKVVISGITDGVTLEAGYNASVIADTSTNQVSCAAIVGAGKGEPCGEIERYPGEDAGTGALLSGGPKCNELVYTINGIPPTDSNDFSFFAINGLRVVTEPENHKIIIVADLENVVACTAGAT